MKTALLVLGAAALFASGPALAKPDHGKGHGSHSKHSKGVEVRMGKHGKHYAYGRSCPPGLRWKNAMCMPPGKHKKLYVVGQRYPRSYGNLWAYNQIPYDLRDRYDFDDDYRYYYGDGYIYRVDPKTMLIREIVNAIVR